MMVTVPVMEAAQLYCHVVATVSLLAAAANGGAGIHHNGHFGSGSDHPFCFGQHHT